VEVRACPALHTREGLSLPAVVEAVLSGLEEGAAPAATSGGDGMSARLIVAVLEGMGTDEATSLVNVAIRYSDRGVAGVDLAGNEALFRPALYARAFAKARYAGLGVTVHAGEGHDSSHVVGAVTELGADRVGHGVSAASDREAMDLLRDRDVTVEVCLSSNLHTGAVSRLEDHPVTKLAAAGVPVTLATDNTFFSDTTLSGEYRLAAERAGASSELLLACVTRSADAAFLPEEDRAELRERYERSMIEDAR
jgi:adenosine deaminase